MKGEGGLSRQMTMFDVVCESLLLEQSAFHLSSARTCWVLCIPGRHSQHECRQQQQRGQKHSPIMHTLFIDLHGSTRIPHQIVAGKCTEAALCTSLQLPAPVRLTTPLSLHHMT